MLLCLNVHRDDDDDDDNDNNIDNSSYNNGVVISLKRLLRITEIKQHRLVARLYPSKVYFKINK